MPEPSRTAPKAAEPTKDKAEKAEKADQAEKSEKPSISERMGERRPSEDDTAVIPTGRHHKPSMNDDEGWQAPGWDNQDESSNPYAAKPKDKQDRHPGEDNY